MFRRVQTRPRYILLIIRVRKFDDFKKGKKYAKTSVKRTYNSSKMTNEDLKFLKTQKIYKCVDRSTRNEVIKFLIKHVSVLFDKKRVGFLKKYVFKRTNDK